MSVQNRQWDHKLKLADVFHDEALTFEQLRDEIILRIRNSNWYWKAVAIEQAANFYEESDLEMLVDEMAETDTIEYFDVCWNHFYNWCDVDKRVWVETQ